MEEQKLMQLIAEMIQAKVAPQEMIDKLTQMGLSEEQAIGAVKMVASKLNGGQEQPEKMEDGNAIQPANGAAAETKYKYEFTKDSMKHPDAGKEYAYLMHQAEAAGYYDAKEDMDGNWTVADMYGRRVPVKVSGNRAYTMQGPRATIQKEQPWLSTIVANSKKPNRLMMSPEEQLIANQRWEAEAQANRATLAGDVPPSINKMQDGSVIQPSEGYVFNEQSAKLGGHGGLYNDAVRSGYYDAIQDEQGNWTAEGQNKKRVPITIGRDGKPYIGNRTYDWLSTVVANSKKPNLNMQAPAPEPRLLAGNQQPAKPLMENGGNLQFYKKGGKMAPTKPSKKEKKCSCGCKLVLKKVGGKITEQCGCGCKVKK